MIKKFLMLCIVCFGLICTCAVGADIITPPSKHPYIFVNDDYIEGIDKEDKVYQDFKSVALKALPNMPENLDADISRTLEIRAFMYLMGEVSKQHAEETINFAINYIENSATNQTGTIGTYKDYGENAIMTGALIYDWCYDALNNETKSQLANSIIALYSKKDSNGHYIQPARANNVGDWTDVAGKSVGSPLVYNSVASAALYSEHPEIYNAMMPKIQGDMAKIVKLYGEAGALSDGSIMYNREQYAYYVYILFERMGVAEGQLDNLYGYQEKVGYKMLYSRTPYGMYVKEGDDQQSRDYSVGRYINSSETNETMALLSAIYENPYLKWQYVKENNINDLMSFLLKKSSVKPMLPDSLPLSFYSSYPGAGILARTSWIDGISSPSAMAAFNLRARRTGDHDHAQLGDFQLYYKGPLTMPQGIYLSGNYGEKHYAGYYNRTISSNLVTVFNPAETFAYGIYNINDGGQKIIPSPLYKYSQHMANENEMVKEESHYIGPNKQTPAFSYIKGILTNAYTDKVTDYKRSMVFMDLFSEEFPAAVVVFDKVSSSNENFQKKWLLQAVSQPQIYGNEVSFDNTNSGGGGKLVNKTLVPENADINVVGGIYKYITNGEEMKPLSEPANTSPAYKSGYRVEVSPTASEKDNIFLNAMFVTDADNQKRPDVKKEETEKFVGVTICDRMVMFSKSGLKVSEDFNLKVGNYGYDKLLCLIADIEGGSWQIEGEGESIIVNSKENENCLIASLKAGDYTIRKVQDAEETHFEYPEVQKEKTGDFAIKYNAGYVNPRGETLIENDIPYVCIDALSELGATLKKEGEVYFAEKNGKELILSKDMTSFIFNGTKIPFKNEMKVINEKLYIPVLEISPFLGCSGKYEPEKLKLTLNSLSKLQTFDGDIAPTEIMQSGTAALFDGFISENIMLRGEEEAIVINMGDVIRIDSLRMFCPFSYNNIKIKISCDGVSYSEVPRSVDTIDGLRSFNINSYAKYIKVFSTDNTVIRELRVFGKGVQVCKSEGEVKFRLWLDDFNEGNVKYIKVIKKDNKIYNLEILNFPQGTVPDREVSFSAPDKTYQCELYIASRDNILNTFKCFKDY